MTKRLRLDVHGMESYQSGVSVPAGPEPKQAEFQKRAQCHSDEKYALMHMLRNFVVLVVLTSYLHAFVSSYAFLLNLIANSNTRMLQRPTFSSSRGESQRIASVPNAPQMIMQKTAVTRASSAHLAYSGYWGSVLAYT